MGHRKKHAPKRGSLAFSPRKRAKSLVPTIKTWPRIASDRPVLLGFAGYKAGMTGLLYIENDEHSIHYRKEVYASATVVEIPDLFAVGLVGYHPSADGNSLVALRTALAKDLPDELNRRIINVSNAGAEKNLKMLEESIERLRAIRVLFATQPRLAGISKKTPDVFEVEVGGEVPVERRFEYAVSILGKKISITDVFQPGDVLDVSAVTKGKGFQGPVKRWGIKILPRKSRKTKRKPGALGPWKPSATMYTIPSAGQMGFHRRTVYGVKVLDIKKPEQEAPVVSLHRYGVLKDTYVILKGSIPGPVKRLVRMRHTVRPPMRALDPPQIVYVQGGI